MGCAQSKIDNEETVNRCKERKTLMKQSVAARNAFAAAHFAYAAALKNTGAALSDYAQGEVQLSGSAASAVDAVVLPPPPYDSLRPPPPPDFSPLQRAATMPELAVPEPGSETQPDAVIEEDDDEFEGEENGLKHRQRSRSSGGGRGRIGISQNENEIEDDEIEEYNLKHRERSRSSGGSKGRIGISEKEAETESLPPPPSPPRRWTDGESKSDLYRTAPAPAPPFPAHDDMSSSLDYFFPAEDFAGPNLAEIDDERSRIEREEIKRKVLEEEERNKIGGDGEKVVEPPGPPAKGVKKVRVPAVDLTEGRRSSVKLNLFQIFSELDDCFLKASQSAQEVSKMLEANRLHYHSNFAESRGHIDISARVMHVITWNKSFKGLQSAEGEKDDFDSEKNETHATVLDKMLAWEKKLYEEVKAGELMKYEYEKKVTSLNKLKERGASTDSIERSKALVSHLHTKYIVDMQTMESTVSEINRLRDEQLYPKLIQLVEAMAVMWENMRIQHDKQSKIAQALRSLDASHSPNETSDDHYHNTHQLHVHVEIWHSGFQNLILHQKDHIISLKNWLKLNLIPIDTNVRENASSSPPRPQNPPIQTLIRTWHDFLEKLPDETTKTAIHNFASVMDTIVHFQGDEMKMRARCEETRRELTRKTRKLEDWYNKHMQRRTPPDEMNPDLEHDKDVIAEHQAVVEALNGRLKEEEEAYQRQCIHVRDKSLMNLKTGLPEVFKAMAEFARACAYMYRSLQSLS